MFVTMVVDWMWYIYKATKLFLFIPFSNLINFQMSQLVANLMLLLILSIKPV